MSNLLQQLVAWISGIFRRSPVAEQSKAPATPAAGAKSEEPNTDPGNNNDMNLSGDNTECVHSEGGAPTEESVSEQAPTPNEAAQTDEKAVDEKAQPLPQPQDKSSEEQQDIENPSPNSEPSIETIVPTPAGTEDAPTPNGAAQTDEKAVDEKAQPSLQPQDKSSEEQQDIEKPSPNSEPSIETIVPTPAGTEDAPTPNGAAQADEKAVDDEPQPSPQPQGKSSEEQQDVENPSLNSEPNIETTVPTPEEDAGSIFPANTPVHGAGNESDGDNSNARNAKPADNAVPPPLDFQSVIDEIIDDSEGTQNPITRRQKNPNARSKSGSDKKTPKLCCKENDDNGKWRMYMDVDEATDCYHDGVLLRDNVIYKYEGKVRADNKTVVLSKDKPVIFRFGRNWSGTGANKEKITKANEQYIVIAHKDFIRENDEERDDPEECDDPDYFAHRFNGFDADQFQQRGRLYESSFDLRGQDLYDAGDHGKLFNGHFPVLVRQATLPTAHHVLLLNINSRKILHCVVDVNENRKIELSPEGQPLPVGTYIVAVVDGTKKVRYQQQFRYCAGLESILINDKVYRSNLILEDTLNSAAIQTNLSFQLPEDYSVSVCDNADNIKSIGHAHFSVEINSRVTAFKFMVTDELSGMVEVEVYIPIVQWGLDLERLNHKRLTMTKSEVQEYNGGIIAAVPNGVRHVRFQALDQSVVRKKCRPDEQKPYLSLSLEYSFTLLKDSDSMSNKGKVIDITMQVYNQRFVVMTIFDEFSEAAKCNPIVQACSIIVPPKCGKLRSNKGFSLNELDAACILKPFVIGGKQIKVDERRNTCKKHNVDHLRHLRKEQENE